MYCENLCEKQVFIDAQKLFKSHKKFMHLHFQFQYFIYGHTISAAIFVQFTENCKANVKFIFSFCFCKKIFVTAEVSLAL